MSLTPEQMAQTAEDLRANLDRAALTPEELAARTGLDAATLDGVLAMDGTADPATVWSVRDAVEQVLREEGDAGDWSVLTDANRERAQGWFGLPDAR